jgi:hypothetical protein
MQLPWRRPAAGVCDFVCDAKLRLMAMKERSGGTSALIRSARGGPDHCEDRSFDPRVVGPSPTGLTKALIRAVLTATELGMWVVEQRLNAVREVLAMAVWPR